MHRTARVLNVFLASPGDVKPERQAAEVVTNNLNLNLGTSLECHLRLSKWEDTRPGYGRPQEIINKSVDECDLFIGLLWERWGEHTGKYSSGFEEEYERARERRKRTGSPDIWLVFKAINPKRLKDPGPQLKKVLEFRDAQIVQREVLFRDIRDLDDWKTNLMMWLFQYVLESSKVEPVATQQRAPSTPESASDVTAAHKEKAPFPDQLKQLANSFLRAVNKGDLEFSRQDADLLQEFDIARMFLLCATWVSNRSTGEVIEAHEMNLLYKYREQIETTSQEYAQLLRSVVASEADNVPGWFWFRYMSEGTLRNTLLLMSYEDTSATVRARSLQLLRDARIPVKPAVSTLPFEDGDQSVRSAAYEYLGAMGDEGDLADVEKAPFHNDERNRLLAEEARHAVLLRVNPSLAMKELIEGDMYISEAAMSEFQRVVESATDELLLKGIENSSGENRELCARELARRNSLTKLLAERLTEDPSIKIREIGFCELARQGQKLDFDAVAKSLKPEREMSGLFGMGSLLYGDKDFAPTPKSVILASYESLTTADVLDAVDWFSISGPLAYQFLATRRFEAVSSDIRSDLQGGFDRVKRRSIERIESKYQGLDVKSHISSFEQYDESIRSSFTEAALAGLVANGEPADIRFGREYLTHANSDIKAAAAKIIRRYGGAEDAAGLMELSRESWGKLRAEAGEAALELSAHPFKLAKELIGGSDDKLVKAAFGWLYAQESLDVSAYFEELLSDDSGANRERAVYYFSSHPQLADLKVLLETQLQKDSYYYNVIAWLDRLVYSPVPVKKMFTKELQKQTN